MHPQHNYDKDSPPTLLKYTTEQDPHYPRNKKMTQPTSYNHNQQSLHHSDQHTSNPISAFMSQTHGSDYWPSNRQVQNLVGNELLEAFRPSFPQQSNTIKSKHNRSEEHEQSLSLIQDRPSGSKPQSLHYTNQPTSLSMVAHGQTLKTNAHNSKVKFNQNKEMVKSFVNDGIEAMSNYTAEPHMRIKQEPVTKRPPRFSDMSTENSTPSFIKNMHPSNNDYNPSPLTLQHRPATIKPDNIPKFLRNKEIKEIEVSGPGFLKKEQRRDEEALKPPESSHSASLPKNRKKSLTEETNPPVESNELMDLLKTNVGIKDRQAVNLGDANVGFSAGTLNHYDVSPKVDPATKVESYHKSDILAKIDSTQRSDPSAKIDLTTSPKLRKSRPPIDNSNMKIKSKVRIEDFHVVRVLGTGKYGEVVLAIEKRCGFVCAIKMLKKSELIQEQITQQLIRELKIQSYLGHPNIVKAFGHFHDSERIYILLEVAVDGQLFRQLRKNEQMPEVKVAQLMRQICQAVSEIHSKHIIHRDIKPENMVLHEGVVKICDFGWSVHKENTLRSTFCGTPLYVSPQILNCYSYDQKIDIWSLGIMMYEMVFGQNPFIINTEQELRKIVEDKVVIPQHILVAPETVAFIMDCLEKDPSRRASINQLLGHPFFTKFPEKAERYRSSMV